MNFMQEYEYDFVMAIGDDHTDEDIFKALPPTAITIKVGSHITAARYFIGDFVDVRVFLKELSLQRSTDIEGVFKGR